MIREKVCVIGIWHLGAIYSACLAELGFDVTGVDFDKNKIINLNKGIPCLFEPGLGELVSKNIQSKKLQYTTNFASAVKSAAYVFIAFDTPVNDKDAVNLSDITKTAIKVAKHLESHSILIVSSQVPVGTCNQIKSLISKRNPSLAFDVAYVPENLRLGEAINRFLAPERIVIGCDNDSAYNRVEQLFSVIECPKIRMDLKSAEMTKHALNAFLATSISFINEIANISDLVGADALKVAEALKLDSRIGSKAMLKPGLGFSGGTLARDVKVLQKLGRQVNYTPALINAVFDVNQRQNKVLAKKIKRICGGSKNPKISVFGLTYKAGTSTLRRSASIEIIRDLAADGFTIKAYDPKADLNEIKEQTEFEFYSDPLLAAEGSDALIFVTDWPEFREIDFPHLKNIMSRPVIIDAQNMLDAEKLTLLGFAYYSIGRGNPMASEIKL